MERTLEQVLQEHIDREASEVIVTVSLTDIAEIVAEATGHDAKDLKMYLETTLLADEAPDR